VLSTAGIRRRLGDERGFTLIETLVAILTGVIVTGALFAILEVSVRQTSRISQVAQASQVSRTTMTRIVDELQSACVSAGFAPVQEKSTPSKLVFQNGYSELAEVPGVYTAKGGASGTATEGVRQDSIEWDEKSGYLTDSVELGTGAEVEGKYPVAASKPFRLAEKVTQSELLNPKKEKAMFRYYTYAPTSTGATNEAAATLKEVELKAGEELKTKGVGTAAKVAAVQVSFKTGSYTKEVKLGSGAEAGVPGELTTLTTFAFSAPDSEATVVAGPCE
jgi:type II secretory pathway component PulJ